MDLSHLACLLHIDRERGDVDRFDFSEMAIRRFQLIVSSNLHVLRWESVSIDRACQRAANTFHEFETGNGAPLFKEFFVG